MTLSNSARKGLLSAAVISLLVVLLLELALSVRRETQTWDEACHILAGYSYWVHGDFALNPEHPPLVKLLATSTLLPLHLATPPREKLFSKEEDFIAATHFVYSQNAEQILFRARMGAAVLTLLLAILIFAMAKEMFGKLAGFISLIIVVFEPTVLAHGAVVTTDIGFSCLLVATVFAFYRYAKRPSVSTIVLTGLAAGLALASKHSAILVFPILIGLAISEIWRRSSMHDTASFESRGAKTSRFTAGLIITGAIAVAVLWASYGFHLHPRSGANAEAQVVAYASRLHSPVQAKMISAFTQLHLLPESYLYGLADVGFTADFSHTYLFGRVYPHGQWFYFPAAFLIKSSLPLLILLLLVPFAIALRGEGYRRELWFLIIPAGIYLAVAMASGMNIGVRHILPIYPFLMILAGWAAARLIHRKRQWAYAVALVLVLGILSSVHAFPVYLAYANELWGGSNNTYKYLSDSNVDWGQQLKSIKQYLDGRGAKQCWFAYFADVVTEPSYYGVPCKPLTTIASVWLQHSIDVPPAIDGPVLISAGVLSGYEFGPGQLNPYDQFQRLRPSAVIEHGVFVFDGHFEIPLASALNHVTQSQIKETAGDLDGALAEAQTSVLLAPDSVQTQYRYGDLLMKVGRAEDAHAAYRHALLSAQTVRPEFQIGWVPGLQSALKK